MKDSHCFLLAFHWVLLIFFSFFLFFWHQGTIQEYAQITLNSEKLTLNHGECPSTEWGVQVWAGIELPREIKEGLRLPPNPIFSIFLPPHL